MEPAGRLRRVLGHLRPVGVSSPGLPGDTTTTRPGTPRSQPLRSALLALGVSDVEVAPPPGGLEDAYDVIMTPVALSFVAKLVRQFNNDVDKMLRRRACRKLQLDETGDLPDFLPETRPIRESRWIVPPLPRRLQCRHVDLGDVSPANTEHFRQALCSAAQGIQTDFDDGHCPTWANQLRGFHNIHRAVNDDIPGVPPIDRAPVLMLRPRAWNMVEHSVMVNGKEAPGPLLDFGLLMFHLAEKLIVAESGPFFYLSKLEGHLEARLWNDIFVWTEQQLRIPLGTIKACVLIENVLAAFEMEEILFELRDHSAGLNCGIWDYSASFVNKFGHRSDFVLPDRNKYVSMERHFLKSYMDLVVRTCHQRGAYATGGMAAPLLPSGDRQAQQAIRDQVKRAKLREIQAGADGFMVYDLGLVEDMHKLFLEYAPTPNQLHQKRADVNITRADLLMMPSGGVTLAGLQHNIGVGVLFIEAWLKGLGHYYFRGAVEDSATAEISRSQVMRAHSAATWPHHWSVFQYIKI